VEEVRSLFGDVDRFLGMCGAIAFGMWEGDRFLGMCGAIAFGM